MEIHLTDRSFLDIILSVMEVYHRECLGLLYGNSCRGRVLVDLVIPHQTARRKLNTVIPNIPRLRRVNQVVMQMAQWEHLGFYHSHPQSYGTRTRANLSRIDLKSMEEGQYEIIIAINEQRKDRPWRYLANGELSGSFGGMGFNFAAYTLKKGRKERAPIICPFALGFKEENRAALIDRNIRLLEAIIPHS